MDTNLELYLRNYLNDSPVNTPPEPPPAPPAFWVTETHFAITDSAGTIASGNVQYSSDTLILLVTTAGTSNADNGATVSSDVPGILFTKVFSSEIYDSGLAGANRYTQNIIYVAYNCPVGPYNITITVDNSFVAGTYPGGWVIEEYSGIGTSSFSVSASNYVTSNSNQIQCIINVETENTAIMAFFVDWSAGGSPTISSVGATGIGNLTQFYYGTNFFLQAYYLHMPIGAGIITFNSNTSTPNMSIAAIALETT